MYSYAWFLIDILSNRGVFFVYMSIQKHLPCFLFKFIVFVSYVGFSTFQKSGLDKWFDDIVHQGIFAFIVCVG